MGYWSEHPMGGDAPMDVEYVLRDLLFTDEEQEEDIHWNDEEYKARLEAKLSEATELDYTRGGVKVDFENIRVTEIPGENGKITLSIEQFKEGAIQQVVEDHSYVLPFSVVKYGIRIENEVLSKKVKNMIKDGGAWNRDYPTDVPSNKENGYNGFNSPWDYACQLKDIWDDLMKGEIEFSEVGRCPGLFEAMDKRFEDGHTGMVNID